MSEVELYLGDCLQEMKRIADHSIDAIICDPPYGSTKCAWDAIIPFDDLWKEYKRVIKPSGAIVLFGSQPFTTMLIASNIRWFKYCWTWDKQRGRGHLVVKIRPMQQTEDIAVFGKGRITYNPITTSTKPRILREGSRTSIMGGKHNPDYVRLTDFNYPKTLLSYPCPPNDGLHPTQKPVALIEYLVRTYTNPCETVLDNTCGSGSTGVACMNTGRNFIGIELDEHYFNVAAKRITDARRAAEGLPKQLRGNEADYAESPLFAMTGAA